MVIAKTCLEIRFQMEAKDVSESVSPDVNWTGSDAVLAAGEQNERERTGRNACPTEALEVL